VVALTTQDTVAPLATTPVGAVRRLEWSYNKRDTLTNRSLYTADYRFAFDPADSAGNRFAGHALGRSDELRFAAALFVLGSTYDPPPASIQLWFDAVIISLPDSRRGKNQRVHREIAANVLLRTEQPDIEVMEVCRFFVVRGDSAAWPAGIAHVGADSTQWFIELWEDETYGDLWRSATLASPAMAAPNRTLPTRSTSFGALKALYLQ